VSKPTFRTALGPTAATAVLAIGAPAEAQDDAGNSSDIIVTAQRNNQTKATGGGNVGVTHLQGGGVDRILTEMA
jgi:iron complex outermembrane receptor protein